MGLIDVFKIKVDKLLTLCEMRGVTMKVYCQVRDPWEQARLWRQSRCTKQVEGEIERLKTEGCEFLASCLLDVGPQRMAPKVTNALPGLSWHQWGEAIDAVPLNAKGELNWDDDGGFDIYAEEARSLGLCAGRYWEFEDTPHVQFRTISPPKLYSLKEINDVMRTRFE